MQLERVGGAAALLFAQPWPNDPTHPAVRCLTVDGPTVVLGSSQPAISQPAGVAVVRRRSGGGAVWLDDDVVWFDVWVPTSDPCWSPDVGRASWWIGDLAANVLASLGLTGLVTHRGAMMRHSRSRDVCWLGLGAGEVHDGGGRKVVGIAQRRMRAGALFQVGVLIAPSQWRLGVVAAPPIDAAAIAAVELDCGFDREALSTSLGEVLTASFGLGRESARSVGAATMQLESSLFE